MRTLLTVDWDAFIPEPIEADMGHRESRLFREQMWMTGCRNWLRDIMIPSDYAAPSFWNSLDVPHGWSAPRYLSDSHVVGFELCKKHDIECVVIVDQHHDLWPYNANDGGEGEIHCGNWLRAAVELLNVRSIIWFSPAFSHCNDPVMISSLRDEMSSKGATFHHYDIKHFAKWSGDGTGGKLRVDAVHVCRSSCWTPPWCDRDFRKFVSRLHPCDILDPGKDQGLGEWNPLDQRPMPSDETSVGFQQFIGSSNPQHSKQMEEMKARTRKWIEECGEHPKALAALPPEGAKF